MSSRRATHTDRFLASYDARAYAHAADVAATATIIVLGLAVVLSFAFIGNRAATSGGEVVSSDPYESARQRSLKLRKPFLVFVSHHDCPECQEMEKNAISRLDTRAYEFGRVYLDEDRERAMKVIWGHERARSLRAMSQTTVPQLMLWLPLSDGRWIKYRLANPPTSKG